MLDQISPVLLESPSIADSCSLAIPHPELAGQKVRMRGTTPVYLIDPEGYRRLVPFPLTFMNLFEDRELLKVLVTSAVAGIPEGPALENGALLMRGNSCDHIYLLDQGRKRRISSRQVMEKYGFSEKAAVVVPKILIDAVPEGEVWE